MMLALEEAARSCGQRQSECPSCERLREIYNYYSIPPEIADMDAPLPPALCDEWKKFLADDGARDANAGLDALFSHPLLFPLQRRRELDAMLEVAAAVNPRTLLVIGGDKGGDLYSFLKALPSIRKAVTIEIRGTPYIDLFRAAFPHVSLLGLPESSYATATVAKVREFFAGDKIDVAFLDGDKSYFILDFTLYKPMMRAGGVMALHDVNPVHGNDPTVAAWKQIKASGVRTGEIIDTSEGREAQERQKRGEKARTSHEGWAMTWGETSCGVGVVNL